MDLEHGYIVIAIVLIAFLGVSTIFTIYGIVNLRRARRSAAWPEVSGKIQKSLVGDEKPTTTGFGYYPEITYEYEVRGVRYQSDTIAFGLTNPIDEEKACLRVERYQLGDRVSVYYDPNEPKVAVLEPGNETHILKYIVIGVVIFIIVSLIILLAVTA